MNMIPGKVNKIDDRTLIYEAGDNIETICYVKQGTVTMETPSNTKLIGEGFFVGHTDIYEGFYSANYYAESGTEIIPVLADSFSTLVQFLNANPAVHDVLAVPFCRMLVDLHDRYCTLFNEIDRFYGDLNNSYKRYLDCCKNSGIEPVEFAMPHSSHLYKFDAQDFAKNYDIMSGISSSPEKAAALYKANGSKFLKIQSALISSIFTSYDDMVYYMRSIVSIFTGKSEQCLFAIVSKLNQTVNGNSDDIKELLKDMKASILSFDNAIQKQAGIALDIDYNRVDFFFMTSSREDDDDIYANSFDDDDDNLYADAFDDDDDNLYADAFDDDSFLSDFDDENKSSLSNEKPNEVSDADEYPDSPNFSNTLKQLCDFAGMSDRYKEFNSYIEQFMALSDKDSRDDSARGFRKKFAAAYYELYEEIFINYARNGERNCLVELFLNFGLVDERLLTDEQLNFLCSIPSLRKTEPCKVYRMKDWLMRIYNGEELPSKNEFDMEYVDYVRDKKKNEALSPAQERELLNNNELKVRFEIQNMFKYNNRLISGNLLAFVPMLHMDNFESSMDSMILTSEAINEQVSKLLQIDYSVFYREMLYENREKKIEKEAIQKEIFPNIILFPIVGVNGIMWQEISGKRSNSEGRIFLPAFFTGKLEDTFLTLFGKFRWELCKTIQGTAWNNISVPSLTSEYADYIQFYRKNKDLTPDKKEALKNQFTRCRNNMREIFVYDYIIWMKFESTGAIRLNKIARRMLATYCPFTRDIRKKVATQPIFEEAMSKFERERQKKIKELQLRFKALEKKGAEITEELSNTQRFYEEL